MVAEWYSNVISSAWWSQFLHPGELRDHGGYWFYSGIFALSYLGGIVTIIYQSYKHHNCHVDGCKKIGHLDPAVHAPACKDHHSLGHLHGKSQAK